MKNRLLEALKTARKKAGLTQRDVEQKLGLRNLALKDYETGRLKIPLELAVDLANLYQIGLDELASSQTQNNKLTKLETLFEKNRLDIIFLDPIIRSYVEQHKDQMFNLPIYDILTLDLNNREKEEFAAELMKYLFSTLGSDNRVLKVELNFIASINSLIGRQKSLSEFEIYIHKLYTPVQPHSVLDKHLPLKHFLIWIMFFLAESDNHITAEEVQYIQKIAKSFKIMKQNYLFIYRSFCEEEVK